MGPDEAALDCINERGLDRCNEYHIAGTVHCCIKRPSRAAPISSNQPLARLAYTNRVPLAVRLDVDAAADGERAPPAAMLPSYGNGISGGSISA
jgi:hypothetical protein